jgi:C4-dicarboxylate transporter, DctM subunit
MLDPNIAVLISLPFVLGLLIAGIPVFVSLGLTGLIGLFLIEDVNFGLLQLKAFPYINIASYLLVVIPLFIIMGNFAYRAGMTRDFYEVGHKWLSRLPGGLAITTIGASALFAACSGSSVATAATMGTVAVPEMEKLGYDSKLACGVVAAGGTLGVMIPPSVLLVFYAAITETSAGHMLIGGVIPGLVSVIIFIFGILFMAWRDPSLCPSPVKVSWKEMIISLKKIWSMAVLFLIVIGGLYIGWFTPTEVAAVGATIAFIFMVSRKKDGNNNLWSSIKFCFTDSLRTTAMVFIVIVGAGLYAYFLTLAQVPQAVCAWAGSAPIPPLAVVALFSLIYIPLGMFVDSFSVLLITLPIMYPVVVDVFGMNPVWFGILSTALCEIGLITPPVGLNVYVLAGVVRHVPLPDIFRGCFPFVIMQFIMIALLFAIPEMATWLPSTMK